MIYIIFHAMTNLAAALGICFFCRNLIEWKEQYRQKQWKLAAGYVILSALLSVWMDQWAVFLLLQVVFGSLVLYSGISMQASRTVNRMTAAVLVYILCKLLINLVYICFYQEFFLEYQSEEFLSVLLILQGIIFYYIVIVMVHIISNRKLMWEWVGMAGLLFKDIILVQMMYERSIWAEWFAILLCVTAEFLFFWKSTDRERKNERQTSGGYMSDASLYEYYMQMEEMHSVIRRLHHDMKNHLMVLEGVGEGEEENEYLTRLNEQLSEMDCFYNTGNVYLNVLLFEKHKAAEAHQIKFEVRVEKDALNFINSADICTIFGDALDNALEACMGRMGQYIEVKAGSMGNDVVIIVANTTDKQVSDGERGQILQSKKKNQQFHGIGISSIQSTVRRYSGQMKIAVKDGMFRMTIIIGKQGLA